MQGGLAQLAGQPRPRRGHRWKAKCHVSLAGVFRVEATGLPRAADCCDARAGFVRACKCVKGTDKIGRDPEHRQCKCARDRETGGAQANAVSQGTLAIPAIEAHLSKVGTLPS